MSSTSRTGLSVVTVTLKDEVASGKMQGVWDSQGMGENLATKLWPVPHEFNAAMQDEAFTWLNSHLAPTKKENAP